MFLLDPVHPVFGQAAELIASRPGITMRELLDALRERGQTLTLTHLYRIVNRMIDAQIVLKDKAGLSLNSMWLGQMELFAQDAMRTLGMSAGKTVGLPLAEGQKISLHAETLRHVQALWYDLLVQVHRETGDTDREVYKYYSHAWWVLRGGSETESFYGRIAERGIACFWLYGNDNVLNLHAAKKHKTIFESKVTERPPFPSEGYNINIHGEYIVECVFPANIARHFALLFRGTASMKEFDPAVLEDLFDLKAAYTVTVWRNARMAAQLKSKIRRFFRAV